MKTTIRASGMASPTAKEEHRIEVITWMENVGADCPTGMLAAGSYHYVPRCKCLGCLTWRDRLHAPDKIAVPILIKITVPVAWAEIET